MFNKNRSKKAVTAVTPVTPFLYLCVFAFSPF